MIILFFTWIILLLWLGLWSSLAGDSFPIRSINIFLKDKLGKSLGGKLPEIILAASISSIGTWGWNKLVLHFFNYDLPLWALILMWIIFTIAALGGKESGTWGYLNHEGHTKDVNQDGIIDNKDARDGTLTKWNIWLASRFGWQLGDEGFSWVWAFTKGFITTSPLMFLGMIFQPIGREIASHAKDRLPGDSNFYMEYFGDGFGYATATITFISIVLYIT